MPTKQEMWSAILDEICQSTDSPVTRTLLDDTTIYRMAGHKITLITPSAFKRDMIRARYEKHIIQALYTLYSQEYIIEIVIGEEQKPGSGIYLPPIDAAFTFENFVVGPSNNFAHAVAAAVADSPGSNYNPFFLYGGSGLGKTHLIYAIANKLRQISGHQVKVVNNTAEEFTRDLVLAIQTKERERFHEKYRGADLFLMDDVQFLAIRDFAQEEFFHIFNQMYEARKQIVLTSDRPPKDVNRLEERLRTRFEWGIVVDVQPPDFETRLAIVKVKAAAMHLILPDELAEYIATNITVNVRQLEGTIKKLMAYHELMRCPLNLETVEKAVVDFQRENPGLNPTPELIITETCRFYDVNEEDVLSTSRRAPIVMARQVSTFLIRQMTSKSLQDIGAIFRRDHSTIMHSIDRIEELMAIDRTLQNDIRMIGDNIRGH